MIWFKTIDNEHIHKDYENSIETLEKKVKSLEFDIETLRSEQKKIISKYTEWIIEKDEYIKQIRDRIEKKLDYHNTHEPQAKKKTFNQMIRERMENNLNGNNQFGKIQE